MSLKQQPAGGKLDQQRRQRAEAKFEYSSGAAELLHLPLAAGRNSSFRRFLVAFFLLVSLSLFFTPRILNLRYRPSSSSTAVSIAVSATTTPSNPCPAVAADDTICCDRTSFRTDVCIMHGDVRTHSPSSTIFLHLPIANNATSESTPPPPPPSEQLIHPYPRKWEANVMATIDELRLTPVRHDDESRRCDVEHDVPAVVFSTGGYTGNVYHEFNDGLIPLYITARHFNRKVVILLLEYHSWWITKYGDVVSQLTDYPPVDFSGDTRTHCFPEAIVGLRFHDELAVDPSKMPGGRTIVDFRRDVLDRAYGPRISQIAAGEEDDEEDNDGSSGRRRRPRLVIMSRRGSREIENEEEVVKEAEGLGFRVEVLLPSSSTEMARIYKALNSCDAMVGVHGAALTHLLFLRPGSVFIQVVPLGTEWAAEAYYGGPARKLGLRYEEYRVAARESSLHRRYAGDDPVLTDPGSVNARGWETTKRVYLDWQSVRLDMRRFRRRLAGARRYLISRSDG